MNFNKSPEFKTPESFSPGPALDRNKIVDTIRFFGIGTPEARDSWEKYFNHLCKDVEAKTGEGNIKVSIEMAKICHDAGFVEEAFSMLVQGEASLSFGARSLGLSQLDEEIHRLADEWEANYTGSF